MDPTDLALAEESSKNGSLCNLHFLHVDIITEFASYRKGAPST